MKNTLIIACIAVIILLALTNGCDTPANNKAEMQLMPSQAGLIRFDPNTGQTDFLMQTPVGMRWMPVPESEVELIMVPSPPGTMH